MMGDGRIDSWSLEEGRGVLRCGSVKCRYASEDWHGCGVGLVKVGIDGRGLCRGYRGVVPA